MPRRENAKARLFREKAVLEADSSVDFRDKYLPLIYESEASLFNYFEEKGKYFIIALGTNNCLDELKKYTNYIENEKQSLLFPYDHP